MAEELTRSLMTLAERGEPRGAGLVLEAARTAAARPPVPARPTWPRGLVVAVAAAVAALVLIGAGILLARPFGGQGISPATTEPSVATTITPITDTGGPGQINDVLDLAFAPDGALWAATNGGVVQWDTATNTPVVFAEPDGLPSGNVALIDVAPDGTVWTAGNDWIARFDDTWQVYSSADVPRLGSPVNDLVVDDDGEVWIVTGGEHLLRFDGSWTTVSSRSADRDSPLLTVLPNGLAVDPAGTLWASTWENGVSAYDGTTWQHHTEGVPAMTGNVAAAPDGTVWVGSETHEGTGIATFDGSGWRLFTVADGLLANDGAVVLSPDGTVWAVHDPTGLSRFDGSAWTTYPYRDEHLFVVERGAAVAADGSLWIPSDEGIIGFDGTAWTRLLAQSETAPPLPAITLSPALGVDPIRVSTVIGDLEFTTLQSPAGVQLLQLAGTPYGPVAIDDFTKLRWSTDGATWEGVLPAVSPWRISTDAGDVIVQGPGFARYAWEGGAWTEVSVVGLPGPVRHLAFGPRGSVAVSDTTVFFSGDGVDFAMAEAPPSRARLPDGGPGGCGIAGPSSWTEGDVNHTIGPVLATDSGFVALTARRPSHWNREPLCEPVLWVSADGNRWELLSPTSPFGDGAAIHNIGEHAGRFVAVGGIGGEGAVWISDDGVSWQRADVAVEMATGIAGGDLGWILTGSAVRGDPLAVDMWFSRDGLTWDGPYEGPETLATVYSLPQLAVGTDMIFGNGGTHDNPVIARLQD